jgi:hypothetical protein
MPPDLEHFSNATYFSDELKKMEEEGDESLVYISFILDQSE